MGLTLPLDFADMLPRSVPSPWEIILTGNPPCSKYSPYGASEAKESSQGSLEKPRSELLSFPILSAGQPMEMKKENGRKLIESTLSKLYIIFLSL